MTEEMSYLKRESEGLKNKTKELDVRTLALEHRWYEFEENDKTLIYYP